MDNLNLLIKDDKNINIATNSNNQVNDQPNLIINKGLSNNRELFLQY